MCVVIGTICVLYRDKMCVIATICVFEGQYVCHRDNMCGIGTICVIGAICVL